MSAHNSSDATPSEANVATPAAPAAPVAIDGFGASRGTGLARGKRPARPATSAPTGSVPVAGYQPTAIQVVVAKTEYVNPFAPEPVAAPVAEAVPPVFVPAPSQPAVAPAPVVPLVVAPVSEPVASVPAPAPAIVPPEPVAPAPKAELNILPPAAPRPVTSWESSGASSAPVPAAAKPASPATPTGDRPVFRIERKPIVAREIEPLRPVEGRTVGEPARRDGRDGGRRGDDRRREGGDSRRSEPRPAMQTPVVPAKSGSPVVPPAAKNDKGPGFMGWLKGIFGGGPEASAPAGQAPRTDRGPRPEGQGQPRGEGRGDGRGRRGGRGRSGGGGGYQGQGQGQGQPAGENRGPRPEGQGQGQPRPPGEGGGRRRHRGGRGRGPRPEGGGPRPEGGSPRPQA